MTLLIVGAVIVALLTGMCVAVSRRQRRGTARNVPGDGRTGTDPLVDQWKWKAHMGGGGGHQGRSPGL